MCPTKIIGPKISSGSKLHSLALSLDDFLFPEYEQQQQTGRKDSQQPDKGNLISPQMLRKWEKSDMLENVSLFKAQCCVS